MIPENCNGNNNSIKWFKAFWRERKKKKKLEKQIKSTTELCLQLTLCIQTIAYPQWFGVLGYSSSYGKNKNKPEGEKKWQKKMFSMDGGQLHHGHY